MTGSHNLLISIVSHGQGDLVAGLLTDVAGGNWSGGFNFEVVVTLNIPEDEAWLSGDYSFPIHIIRNESPKGFGANHNAAFNVIKSTVFAVVNPDIRLDHFKIVPLMAALEEPKTGVCGPRVVGPDGVLQDSARRFPTVRRLLSRVLLRRRYPDFSNDDGTISVDWLGGMFLMFPSGIFREIGGFDERYFMYMEDVEICQNLWRRGFMVMWVSGTAVTHDARRATGRSFKHLRWHLTSMAKYFFQRQRKV